VAAYLIAQIDQPTLAANPALSNCPVVTFIDPMSIDDANRIVVMSPDATTMVESPGNCEVTIEVGIKSQWAQPSMAADYAAHFQRVNVVRIGFSIQAWPMR